MQRENPPLPEISVWLLLFQLNLEQSHLHEMFSSPLNIFIPKPQIKRKRKTELLYQMKTQSIPYNYWRQQDIGGCFSGSKRNKFSPEPKESTPPKESSWITLRMLWGIPVSNLFINFSINSSGREKRHGKVKMLIEEHSGFEQFWFQK